MRIIGGYLGGRNFESPHGNRTHPMSDKVRGALFNALGDLSNLEILDPFGGTGALSFEAISRGAKQATVIELDRKAQQTIERNISTLGLGGRVLLVRANAAAWLKKNEYRRFNVIVADPPYDEIKPEILKLIAERLEDSGILVLSWPGNDSLPTFEGLKEVSTKKYGDAQLAFYKQVQ